MLSLLTSKLLKTSQWNLDFNWAFFDVEFNLKKKAIQHTLKNQRDFFFILMSTKQTKILNRNNINTIERSFSTRNKSKL